MMQGGTLAAGWGALTAGLSGAAAVGVQAWRRRTPAALSWDGSAWRWAGSEGDLRVMIDLDRWMLLRFDALPQGRRWIAASRRAAVGPWPALRAALHSRRAASPSPDAPSV